MLCYFISKKDFSLLNCVEASSFSVSHDLNCGGKTTITISGNPHASDEDFVILKEGKETKFNGIVENIKKSDGEQKYTVSCMEIENAFDRKIPISDTDIIKNIGIEDFIANTIQAYFIDTGDAFIDMPYVVCNVQTHTKVNSKPAADDGIYNLKTYIGNTKEQYGIFLDFEFTKTNLIITISKKNQSFMKIDTNATDVYKCNETYKVKVLSKLTVLWLNPITQEQTTRNFYLHSDRSISEINKDRVNGTISTIFVENESEEEMIQEARNEFKSNSYSHAIETEIFIDSKIYPLEELYVGHEVLIKTAAAGIKESIISSVSISDNSNVIKVKFGILKVTLTDKLK